MLSLARNIAFYNYERLCLHLQEAPFLHKMPSEAWVERVGVAFTVILQYYSPHIMGFSIQDFRLIREAPSSTMRVLSAFPL